MRRPVSVSVFGASGFTGALAAELLQAHPAFELRAVTSRSDAGQRLDALYPRHRVPLLLEELDLDRHADVDAAIVAYPHGASAPTVAGLRERGVRVVDLSADFRLADRDVYEAWYGEHRAPALFGQGAYGLPERHREEIAGSDLVANPGCFPTATVIALAPLARAGLVGGAVVDVKTGVSGAGRTASERTHFVSVDENVVAYAVHGHRHGPEVDQELARAGAPGVRVTIVPHLLPIDQGELVTSYVDPTRAVTPDELADLFVEAYAGEPFVELADRPPGVREVRATNLCRLAWALDVRTGRIVVLAAVDNLWKGASSQAVQNLNLMFDRPEAEGLGATAVAYEGAAA